MDKRKYYDRDSQPIRVKKVNLERLQHLFDKSWNQVIEDILPLIERKELGFVAEVDVYKTEAKARGESMKRAIKNKQAPAFKVHKVYAWTTPTV